MTFGNVIINEPNDLIGSLANFGADPFLVETDEEALEVFESLERASSGGRELIGDEFETAKRQLDLENNEVSHIWSFVDGSEFIICFSECWF